LNTQRARTHSDHANADDDDDDDDDDNNGCRLAAGETVNHTLHARR
jgi:hypothetical protein